MSDSIRHAYLAAVRVDLGVFLRQAFATVHPGRVFLDNWHLEAIVNVLEQAMQGQLPRLIINLPPRHLKSFLLSVAWSAFILGQDPTAKIIVVSYADELAKPLAREFRRIVESAWYRRLFPNVRLVKATENEVATDAGGGRYATTVGGTLTGRGGDFIIVDDPAKPEEMLSDTARNAINDWYRNTLLSRLDDKQRSVLVIVMQRLHVNDLTGYVEAGGGFHKLAFPAIATRDEVVPLRHGEHHHRRQGEPLHAGREGLDLLRAMRDQLGGFYFAAQYQQSPETPDGALFKRDWFKIVDRIPRRSSNSELYISVDTAISTSMTADYSAFSMVLVDGPRFYVLHADRGRWSYETLKARLLRFVDPDSSLPVSFFIEAAGSGISLIKALRDRGLRCLHYHPKKDKVTRAAHALPIVEAGRVHLLDRPGKSAWIESYLNEFTSFPHGRFDDQVDSLVQLLIWADKRHTGVGFMEIF
jgi:predicted phage terminase large subunit-like protein